MPRLTFPLLCLLALLTLAAPALAAEIPATLSGIGLGEDAAKHKGRIRADRAKDMDGAPWLRRLPVTGDKFFTGGYVLVGKCAAPGRIVRIKMHYRDASLEFYRSIAGDMIKSYGDPAEYKGDFDGRTMGNKWGFVDPWTRPVSLIIQRTEGQDPELGTGNTIKLTNWGLLEAERTCWQERHRPQAPAKPNANAVPSGQDNGYLPR